MKEKMNMVNTASHTIFQKKVSNSLCCVSFHWFDRCELQPK